MGVRPRDAGCTQVHTQKERHRKTGWESKRRQNERKRLSGGQQSFVRLNVNLLSKRPRVWAFPRPGGPERAEV